MKAPSLRYAHIKQRGLATVCDKEDGQLSITMFTAPLQRQRGCLFLLLPNFLFVTPLRICYADFMLYVILFLGAILPTLLFRYFIVGKKAYRINRLLFTICLIVLPFSVYLSITQIHKITDHVSKLSRPFVTGTIIKSEIVGNEKAYHPEITYQYTVDSVTYTKSSNINSPMFGNKRKQYDVAEVTTEEYPVGKTLEILYNPSNPADSDLHIALPWNVYGQLGFGVTLIILSFFGLLLPRKKSWI